LYDDIIPTLPLEPGEEVRVLARTVPAVLAITDRRIIAKDGERLALAIVSAGRERSEPGIVCLDEPTRGMDGERKAELVRWLVELAGRGSAALVATHDVEFASRFANRVVLLGDGELIADGPVDEILSGGWYFATEVARVLGGDGAITPEAGARVLRAALGADTIEAGR